MHLAHLILFLMHETLPSDVPVAIRVKRDESIKEPIKRQDRHYMQI